MTVAERQARATVRIQAASAAPRTHQATRPGVEYAVHALVRVPLLVAQRLCARYVRTGADADTGVLHGDAVHTDLDRPVVHGDMLMRGRMIDCFGREHIAFGHVASASARAVRRGSGGRRRKDTLRFSGNIRVNIGYVGQKQVRACVARPVAGARYR